MNRLAFPYRWSTRAILMDKTDATKLLTKIRRQWFAKLGCASCHQTSEKLESLVSGPTLAKVNVASADGCLAEKPKTSAATFDLSKEQRGAIANIPGKLVDLLTDPVRDRVYVVRQDKNLVLVLDGTSFAQIAALRHSDPRKGENSSACFSPSKSCSFSKLTARATAE